MCPFKTSNFSSNKHLGIQLALPTLFSFTLNKQSFRCVNIQSREAFSHYLVFFSFIQKPVHVLSACGYFTHTPGLLPLQFHPKILAQRGDSLHHYLHSTGDSNSTYCVTRRCPDPILVLALPLKAVLAETVETPPLPYTTTPH